MLKIFTRGGQLALHQVRMFKQLGRILLLLFTLVFVLSSLAILSQRIDHKPYYFSLLLTSLKASVSSSFNDKATVILVDGQGRRQQFLARTFHQQAFVQQQFGFLKQEAKISLLYGLSFSLLMLVLLMAWFYTRGQQSKRKFVRGNRLVSARTLARQVKKSGLKTNFTLGKCPVPEDDEHQHFFIHGTTGSGKSQCIKSMLHTIRARGQQAVVYDKGGELLAHFFRPGKDILLNPLDARGSPWSLWAECRHSADYEALSEAFIPSLPGFNSDPFWNNAARTLLATSAQALASDHKRSMVLLLQHLFSSDLNTLQDLLKGTAAESMVSETVAKTTLNIKSVLATHLYALKYMQEGPHPFSIRQWVQQDNNDSWLFLSSRQNQHAALRPLISAWLNVVFYTLLSVTPQQRQTLWLVLDELPSLQRLPHLLPTLAEGRKFGGAFIVGMQNYRQLQAIYGSEQASTLASLCNTQLFLRSTGDINQWVSAQLGEMEIEEVTEGMSYGASEHRDGVNLSKHRRTMPLVLNSEIRQLKDLQGYLLLKGDWPLAKVMLPWVEDVVRQPSFVGKTLMALGQTELGRTVGGFTVPFTSKPGSLTQVSMRDKR